MENREIKFRAVLPDGHWAIKRYGKVVEDYTSTQLFESLGFWSQDEGVVYLQYTGLKDLNEKEIFHKDILKFENGDTVVVEMEEWLEFFIEPIGDVECDDQWRDLYRIERAEIIGNAFETPELLSNNG